MELTFEQISDLLKTKKKTRKNMLLVWKNDN